MAVAENPDRPVGAEKNKSVPKRKFRKKLANVEAQRI